MPVDRRFVDGLSRSSSYERRAGCYSKAISELGEPRRMSTAPLQSDLVTAAPDPDDAREASRLWLKKSSCKAKKKAAKAPRCCRRETGKRKRRRALHRRGRGHRAAGEGRTPTTPRTRSWGPCSTRRNKFKPDAATSSRRRRRGGVPNWKTKKTTSRSHTLAASAPALEARRPAASALQHTAMLGVSYIPVSRAAAAGVGSSPGHPRRVDAEGPAHVDGQEGASPRRGVSRPAATSAASPR